MSHTTEAGWLLLAAATAFSFSRDPATRLGGALLIGAGCLLSDLVMPPLWIPVVLILGMAALYDAVMRSRMPPPQFQAENPLEQSLD